MTVFRLTPAAYDSNNMVIPQEWHSYYFVNAAWILCVQGSDAPGAHVHLQGGQIYFVLESADEVVKKMEAYLL